MIAVDGSGHMVFKGRHCPNCLTKEKNEKIVYHYHRCTKSKTGKRNRAGNISRERIYSK